MPPQLASLVCIIFIGGLFWLDRDRKARTSGALWLPVLWLTIIASRTASSWMAIFGFGNVASSMNSAQAYLEGSPFDASFYAVLTALGVIVLLQRHQKAVRILRF
jgi:hypothetical protein